MRTRLVSNIPHSNIHYKKCQHSMRRPYSQAIVFFLDRSPHKPEVHFHLEGSYRSPVTLLSCSLSASPTPVFLRRDFMLTSLYSSSIITSPKEN